MLSLGKRKRRASRSDTVETQINKIIKEEDGTELEDLDSTSSPTSTCKVQMSDEEARRERKRMRKLKKRRREEEGEYQINNNFN